MKLSLQSQIFTALVLITSIFVAILGVNVHRFALSNAAQENLLVARAVSLHTTDMANRATRYAEVAPRDFPAYNRDVALFYPNLKRDLMQLDVAVNNLNAIRGHEQSVTDLQTLHANFVAGLDEQIGDVDEPRLEWAARFLAAETGPLQSAAAQLEDSLRDAAQQSLADARRLSQVSWIISVVAILAGLLWFWMRVTRRINHAVDGCQQVAEGEFGTRIEDPSGDEIGQFANAFNALSSRTRVVLGVVDHLDSDATPAQAFDTFWEQSYGYLGHQWQGMFLITDDLTEGQLVSANGIDPNALVGSAGDRYSVGGIISELGLSAESPSAMWSDIRRHTLAADQAKLLRELSLLELRTVAFVLLTDDSGKPTSLMAFAWKDADAESAGVASFLAGLGRFMSRLLVPPVQSDTDAVEVSEADVAVPLVRKTGDSPA